MPGGAVGPRHQPPCRGSALQIRHLGFLHREAQPEKLYLERWEEVRLLIVKTLKIPIKLSGELEVRDSHEDTVIGGHEQKESVIDRFPA